MSLLAQPGDVTCTNNTDLRGEIGARKRNGSGVISWHDLPDQGSPGWGSYLYEETSYNCPSGYDYQTRFGAIRTHDGVWGPDPVQYVYSSWKAADFRCY